MKTIELLINENWVSIPLSPEAERNWVAFDKFRNLGTEVLGEIDEDGHTTIQLMEAFYASLLGGFDVDDWEQENDTEIPQASEFFNAEVTIN